MRASKLLHLTHMCNNFQSSASCDVDIYQSVADDYSSEPAPHLPRTELQEVLLPQVGSRSTRPHIRLLWAKCLLLQARRRLLKQLSSLQAQCLLAASTALSLMCQLHMILIFSIYHQISFPNLKLYPHH